MERGYNIGFLKGLNLKLLKFHSSDDLPYSEEAFTREYLARSAVFTRYSMMIGFFFYSIFAILDVALVPDQKNVLWFIRFAVVDPILLILIILSYVKSLQKYVEAFGFIALIVAGAGISVMVAIADPPANYSYYAGIILVFMLGYGLVRIRFKWAVAAGWINVAIYEVIAIFMVDTPAETLINNNFFFISANILGMLSCYAVEYYIRKNYVFALLLESEKETVDKLNRNLESLVEERTAELKRVNEALQSQIDARNQVENENREMEKKLYQAQKMESLGNFAGGIAHDFNNILTTMLGYTELCLSLADEGSVLKGHLELIYGSGERASQLVWQILSFARKSDKEIRAVRPDEILKEVMKFIRSTIPATIEIKTDIKSESYIMGNDVQLHQIFMNLFTNAAFAMKETGGVLSVSLHDRPQESPEPPFLVIEIADTGEGISPENLSSIFDPYFTTKKAGEGTGLGLSVVHGIIESYGGDITVRSALGEGTAFMIRLPVVQGEGQVVRNKELESIGGTESILLIDDEESIAEIGRLLLSGLGYQVVSETDCSKALEIFEKSSEEFDIVITDMMMPVMNGEELCRRVKSIREDIPVIICSGFDQSDWEDRQFAGKSSRMYLSKPYSRKELAQAVRKALGRA